MPFTGVIMLFINLIIYFTVRKLVPRVGVILIAGIITALLKLLYSGGNKIAPAVAIFIEALIIEVLLYCLPQNKATAMVTGALVLPFTLFYPFLSYLFIGGSAGMLGKFLNELRPFMIGTEPYQIMIILIIVYSMAGALAGLTAWSIAVNTVNYYKIHIKKTRTMEVP